MENEYMGLNPPKLKSISWTPPIITALTGLLGCSIALNCLPRQSNLIKQVDLNDINHDGLEDVIITHNSGDKTIYYNTGSAYQTAEQIKQAEIQEIETAYQNQLRQTNDFYQNAYGGKE